VTAKVAIAAKHGTSEYGAASSHIFATADCNKEDAAFNSCSGGRKTSSLILTEGVWGTGC
jgi:hypothetical protein